MNIFMLSNGMTADSSVLLEYALEDIIACFRREGVKKVLVIPYAVISIDYDERVQSLKDSFAGRLDVELSGIHEYNDPVKAVYDADAIMVSGGNTWQLNKSLHDNGLIEAIRKVVLQKNTVYVGWSAGSVICSPTMCTTNDMCIVDAAITASLNFVPFHINPHYIDARLENHMGETRDERIEEFCIQNPHKTVIGIPEGTWLYLSEQGLSYHSPKEKAFSYFSYEKGKKEFPIDKNASEFLTL